MNRSTIINWLILFYGILAGVGVFLLLCGLVFGWVPVPEAAQTEFWRLVIVTMLALGPVITNELRKHQTERIEQRVAQTEEKVERTLEVVSNGLPKRIAEEMKAPRDPNERTRAEDPPAADSRTDEQPSVAPDSQEPPA